MSLKNVRLLACYDLCYVNVDESVSFPTSGTCPGDYVEVDPCARYSLCLPWSLGVNTYMSVADVLLDMVMTASTCL